MAKILDGRTVRDKILDNLKTQIANLKTKPKLIIIQVGDLDESNTYIGQKIKFGQKIGAIAELKKFPADITQNQLTSQLQQLNADPTVHGIIIQLPISQHLDKDELIEMIDPKKDVDGLTATNEELLEENNPDALVPATAKGVITILNYYKVPIKGKKAAVVGRSKLVGKPVATLLRNLGAEVEVGHSQTPNLTVLTKPADIIVVAVGKPNLITKNHVSPGQTVVDVGINVVQPDKVRPWKTERPDLKIKEKGLTLAKPDDKARPFANDGSQLRPGLNASRKLVGDVAFTEVEPIVAAITPVPGGIGPMTVASLYENLLLAYESQKLISKRS